MRRINVIGAQNTLGVINTVEIKLKYTPIGRNEWKSEHFVYFLSNFYVVTGLWTGIYWLMELKAGAHYKLVGMIIVTNSSRIHHFHNKVTTVIIIDLLI